MGVVVSWVEKTGQALMAKVDGVLQIE